ncbi:MAG TPA: ABC transporter permease, partial [Micromonosporaceae bacterium]
MPSLSLNQIGAVTRLNIALYAREPGPLISRIGMPLVLLTVIRPLYTAALGRSDGTAGAAAGMLVTFSLLGMSIVGSAILVERIWHTAPRLRATPAGSVTVLAGKAIPVLGILGLQQSAILAYSHLVFGLSVRSLPLMAATVAVWSITLTALGALLGTLARSGSALSAMVDVGSLTLTGLGGAFVPLALLPAWAKAVAPVSPGYWAVRSLRGAIDGDLHEAATGWLVLTAV